MADDGSAATLARLVGCYGLPPPEAQAVLARAARVAAAPSGALFSTPTTLLSRVLRVLKNAAPAAHRAVVEDCFMSLVTKVRLQLPPRAPSLFLQPADAPTHSCSPLCHAALCRTTARCQTCWRS